MVNIHGFDMHLKSIGIGSRLKFLDIFDNIELNESIYITFHITGLLLIKSLHYQLNIHVLIRYDNLVKNCHSVQSLKKYILLYVKYSRH